MWINDLPPRPDARYGPKLVNMLPATYDAYIRVLHPVQGDGRSISWREVAVALGREEEMSSTIDFYTLIRSPDVNARQGFQFSMGVYPAGLQIEQLQPILSALDPFTPPQICHALLWTGYSFKPAEFEDWPWVVVGPEPLNGVGCQMVQLYTRIGDLAAVTSHPSIPHFVLPNFIWPDDQRWIIASPYDAVSSYIACPQAAAEILLSTEGIETFIADLGDPVL